MGDLVIVHISGHVYTTLCTSEASTPLHFLPTPQALLNTASSQPLDSNNYNDN